MNTPRNPSEQQRVVSDANKTVFYVEAPNWLQCAESALERGIPLGAVVSKLIPYKVFLVCALLYVLLNLQKLKMLFDIFHFHYCKDTHMVVLLYVSSYELSMLPLEKKIFHKLHNHRALNQCANTFNRSETFKIIGGPALDCITWLLIETH